MNKIVLVQIFTTVLVSFVVNSSTKTVKVINSTDIDHIKVTVAPEKKSVYYVYPEGEPRAENHSSATLTHKHDNHPNTTLPSHETDKHPNTTLPSHETDKEPDDHHSSNVKFEEHCYVRVMENNEFVIYNNTREEVENAGKVVHDVLCVDDGNRILGSGTIASIGG